MDSDSLSVTGDGQLALSLLYSSTHLLYFWNNEDEGILWNDKVRMVTELATSYSMLQVGLENPVPNLKNAIELKFTTL